MYNTIYSLYYTVPDECFDMAGKVAALILLIFSLSFSGLCAAWFITGLPLMWVT